MPLFSKWPDGASGAPVGGNFQRSDFFTYARQSGQTYVTRPPWQVAGVDYPVGIDAAHIGSLIDPTISLPANCTKSTFDHIAWAGTGADQTIEGYDFKAHGGANNGVSLRLNGTSAGSSTLTIKNCRFFLGQNVYDSNTTALITTVVGVGAAFNLVIQNCYFDGNGPNFPTSDLAALASHSGSIGTFTAKYNAFLNSPTSMTQTASPANRTELYNYGEGMVFDNDLRHASWPSCQFGGGATMAQYIWAYNTALLLAMPDGYTGVSAVCEISTNGGAGFTAANADHNTIVTNLTTPGGLDTTSYCISFNNAGTVATANIYSNYVDLTGAIGPYATVAASTVLKTVGGANINLVTGLPVNPT